MHGGFYVFVEQYSVGSGLLIIIPLLFTRMIILRCNGVASVAVAIYIECSSRIVMEDKDQFLRNFVDEISGHLGVC